MGGPSLTYFFFLLGVVESGGGGEVACLLSSFLGLDDTPDVLLLVGLLMHA